MGDDRREFLVGAAIGSGIAALAAERGGADFLLAINAGRLRNMGAPSVACMLPILNAIPLTEDFAAREILPQCQSPIYLGLHCWSDDFDPQATATRVASLGFTGVVNFPTSIHYSKAMGQVLSHARCGFEREIQMLQAARQVGLKTILYCATRNQARAGAEAGLDMICLNLGWNAGGASGHRNFETLGEVAMATKEISRIVKNISPKTKFLLEGGPIITPDDLGAVARSAMVDGYVGGSTIERLPMEVSMADQIAGYRRATQQQMELDAENTQLLRWSRRFGFRGKSPALRRFLFSLRAIVTTKHPFLLSYADGADLDPALSTLAGSARKKETAQAIVDVTSEDFPGASIRRLFGDKTGDQQRPALLLDTQVECLIIKSPALFSHKAQIRLARALTEGTIRNPISGMRERLRSRCVLVQPRAADTGNGLNMLTSELQKVLDGWVLSQPTLRERSEDIDDLLDYHFDKAGLDTNNRPNLSHSALQILSSHDWPGNERELNTLIGRIVGYAGEELIDRDVIETFLVENQFSRLDGSAIVIDEKRKISETLWRNDFNRTETAAALNMSRKTLYNKIKKFGLDRA